VTPVPADYADLPQLRGRATVEMTLKKPNGEQYDIEGALFKEAKMKMIIDGYAGKHLIFLTHCHFCSIYSSMLLLETCTKAPVTGGNFIELVKNGFYNNMEIQRSDGFVVQTGKPKGEADGYVGTSSKSIGAGKHGERLIPLEIFVKGDKGPFYETTIEDEARGGEATVLPFSSYGAMGWAREEYEPNSGSSQFFWLLFDSDLTPAGKNVLDGRYPCFGYVVEGADFLHDVKEGDVIVSAKVTEGADKLVLPN
jgi:peptidylprolyl isomerase